jgi:hypothetical protein
VNTLEALVEAFKEREGVDTQSHVNFDAASEDRPAFCMLDACFVDLVAVSDAFDAMRIKVPETPSEVTAGFWWARCKSDGDMTIIKVATRDWVEPDEDDYGVLWGRSWAGITMSALAKTGPFA